MIGHEKMTEKAMIIELKDLVDKAVARYNSSNASLSIYAEHYGRPSFASNDGLENISNRAEELKNNLMAGLEIK